MSEYQRQKARALAMQREKEEGLKRELEAKAKREKEAQKAEAERRKMIEEATKQARRDALKAANDALLQKERPNAAVAEIEFDPFADDTVTGPSKLAPRKPSSSAPRSGNGAPRKPLSGASGSRPSNGVKKEGSAPRKISELPAMGRKEKAAMKLAREAKSDSMFSVQSLVDMAEGTTSSRSVSPRRPPPPRAMPLKKQATTAMAAKSGAKGISGMKKGLDVTGLRKLCPDRDTRDNRTVDEVQRDIRLRKGLVDPAVSRSGPASASSSRPPSAGLPRDRDRDISRGSDRDRDRKALPARRSPPRHAGPGKARRRSPSISDSDSDASTPPRKRRVLGGPDFNGDAPASRAAVSAMIQGMFSRDGAPRRYDDDYSDGSDMEAGLSDIDSEEKRAAKLARREDLEEERKEAERRAAKERAKKMRK